MIEYIINFITMLLGILLGSYIATYMAEKRIKRAISPSALNDLRLEIGLTKEKIFDVVMEIILNALDDEELNKKFEELIQKLMGKATKGAVQGAMPKFKLMDIIGMIALGYAQKSGMIPNAAGASQSAESLISPP
jgi:hypothetical protein